MNRVNVHYWGHSEEKELASELLLRVISQYRGRVIRETFDDLQELAGPPKGEIKSPACYIVRGEEGKNISILR